LNRPLLRHSITPISSALPLLVTAVGANDPDNAFAPDDFAILAKLLH
jgi:hypothetical protein